MEKEIHMYKLFLVSFLVFNLFSKVIDMLV